MFFGMGTARHYAVPGALDAVRHPRRGFLHAIASVPLESRAAWTCWSTKASSCSPATD